MGESMSRDGDNVDKVQFYAKPADAFRADVDGDDNVNAESEPEHCLMDSSPIN